VSAIVVCNHVDMFCLLDCSLLILVNQAFSPFFPLFFSSSFLLLLLSVLVCFSIKPNVLGYFRSFPELGLLLLFAFLF
jgi:hypothetical protein